MGSNWPLHSAQPLGAKLKLTILISDRNGVPIFLSLKFSFLGPGPFAAGLLVHFCSPGLCWGRKDSKQRNDEVDHQEWDHVVMRLRTARESNGIVCHLDRWGHVGVRSVLRLLRPDSVGGT